MPTNLTLLGSVPALTDIPDITSISTGIQRADEVFTGARAARTILHDKTGTATAVTQGYNSYDVTLRGSGWDGAAAQDRDIILRQIITGSGAYRLALIKKEAAVETELLAVNQAGAIVGNLLPDANGTRALGSTGARWDAFIDALDVTGASSLGAVSAIGAIAANFVADANATRNLGAAATRWNAIYGASLDLSGAATVGDNLVVVGAYTVLKALSAGLTGSGGLFLSNGTVDRLNIIIDSASNDAVFGIYNTAWVESFRILNTTGSVQLKNLRLGPNEVTNYADDLYLQYNVAKNLNIHGTPTSAYGNGVKTVFIGNASTVPTANPVGGGILYVDVGALKYRGPNGTVTQLAAA